MAKAELKGGAPGTRYGHLVLIGEAPATGYERRWLLRCDCGALDTALPRNVRSGKKTACRECAKRERIRKCDEKRAGRRSDYHPEWVHLDEDEWRKPDDMPAANGWYDIAVYVTGKVHKVPDGVENTPERPAYLLQAGLYRDGEWVDAGKYGRFVRWREPLRMTDYDGIHSEKGMLNLATEILQDTSEAFQDSFKALVNGSPGNYAEKIEAYRYWNRRLSSPEILRMSMGATQAELVTTMCNRILRRYGVSNDDVDDVRKAIHAEVKIYLYTMRQFVDMADPVLKKAEEVHAGMVAGGNIRGIMNRAKGGSDEGRVIDRPKRDRLGRRKAAGDHHDVR